MRRLLPALLAVLLSVALAVLAGEGPVGAKEKSTPSTTSPVTTTTTTWPPLPAFDTTLAWADCGDGFQCGTLTVPVDWAKPTGEQVGIALIRRPAVAARSAPRVVGVQLRRSRPVGGRLPAPGVVAHARRPCSTASTS